MYAAVITGQIQPGKVDEVDRLVQERVIPSLKTIPGLKRHYGLVDRTTGEIVAVALYETEEAVRAAGNSEQFRQIIGALSSFLAGQPQRKVYEVASELEL